MSFTFRPAVRENVNLLIGLAGGTGSGKTYTAMRLASGIAGDARFAVIDTESGRASHYAEMFKFDVCELRAPFSPDAYADAIEAAVAAGYPVVVVDSMTHEYAGDGGVLDMQEAEFTRMGSRDSAKVSSWIKPKMAHKKMVSRLLQVRAHLILCFRAEPKIDIIKEDGKTKIVPKKSLVGLDGWIPVTEKNLPFELTVSFLLTADAPGMPKPIKLQEQHRALFPLDQPINEESGRGVVAWAHGGAASTTEAVPDFKAELLACTTRAALQSVKERIAAFSKRLDAGALAELRKLVGEAQERMRETATMTFAQVSSSINAAKSTDELDIARDLVRAVPDDGQQAELRAMAEERATGLAA